MTDTKISVQCPACGEHHDVSIRVSATGLDDELTSNPATEKVYRLAEVGAMLGLSRRTLKQYIYDGKLDAAKSTDGRGGTPWLVPESEVVRLKRARGLL